MEMPKIPQEINAYLDRRFSCSCGREHYAPLKFVSIRANALAAQQFDNVAILLQHARPATVMQAGARHAGYTGEQRRNGK